MSPHPLVSAVRRALGECFARFPVGSRVVLAVSGGADSMALALAAQYAARERAIELYSITVDHGIRPDSREEAEAVAQYLASLGIRAQVESIDWPSEDGDRGSNLGPEAQARQLRYGAIADFAKRVAAGSSAAAAPVLLGHNCDDQAQTVVLGLGRGSGARSISGMRAEGSLPEHSDVPMARPLLEFRHADLVTVCEELGVRWFEDPTNSEQSEWRDSQGDLLRRNAIRYRVMPALESALGPGVVEALSRTATMLQRDDAALSWWAERTLREVSVADGESERTEVDAVALRDYPQALRTRVLRLAFLRAGGRGGELGYQHVMALDKLTTRRENNVRIDLPGVQAVKGAGVITFNPGIRARQSGDTA